MTSAETIEASTPYSFEEFNAIIHFILLHKKFEQSYERYDAVPQEILVRYKKEGAEQVPVDPRSMVSDLPCPLVLEDLLAEGEVVRHDGAKTARALQSLFHRVRLRSSIL